MTHKFLFSLMAFFTVSVLNAQTYHEDDVAFLREFLSQGENAKSLGLTPKEINNLHTNEDWIPHVQGLIWVGIPPKRISEINWVLSSEYETEPKIAGSLDLSKCNELLKLNFSSNKITDVNLKNCTKLTGLSCSGNMLTELDVSNCTKLTGLSCSGNMLTELDVSKCPALETIHCLQNQIIELDISQNVWLHRLEANYNKLTKLDISNNGNLVALSIAANQLENLDISNNNIPVLDIRYNKFKFSTLVLPFEIIGNYYYAPQSVIEGGEIEYTEKVDLSSEYDIEGYITTYEWYDITSGDTIPIQISGSNGIFSFDESHKGKILICEMDNEMFPQFHTGSYSPPGLVTYKVKIKGETGIGDDTDVALTVSPNPAKDKLIINGEKIIHIIKIYSLSGELINTYSIESTNTTIDISSYLSGTYLLDIDGKIQKIIVQK